MTHVRIEMDRGAGWELRHEGDVADLTEAAALEHLQTYALQYRHRAIMDGRIVGEAVPVRGRRCGRLISKSPEIRAE